MLYFIFVVLTTAFNSEMNLALVQIPGQDAGSASGGGPGTTGIGIVAPVVVIGIIVGAAYVFLETNSFSSDLWRQPNALCCICNSNNGTCFRD
jgi:hypothetical protein